MVSTFRKKGGRKKTILVQFLESQFMVWCHSKVWGIVVKPNQRMFLHSSVENSHGHTGHLIRELLVLNAFSWNMARSNKISDIFEQSATWYIQHYFILKPSDCGVVK